MADRREQEWAAWDHFASEVGALKDYTKTWKFVLDGPAPGKPGRSYYSNLGFFLRSFDLPDGAGEDELRMYRSLIERFDASGNLNPGVAPRVIAKIDRAVQR